MATTSIAPCTTTVLLRFYKLYGPATAIKIVPAAKKSNGALFGVLGVAALAVAGFFATQSNGTSAPQDADARDAPVVPTTQDTPVVSGATYKDGTYDEKGSYKSPAGPEQVDVKITLKNNIITDATVTSLATNPKSVFMQGMFVSNYKPLFVGKNIDEVHLTKSSGSSLTPIGFNDALAKIKADAMASYRSHSGTQFAFEAIGT